MRDIVRMQVFSEMREYPILLCPVASIPAFRRSERSWEIDGKTVQYLDAWSYTEWFNLLGTPAVAVPFGRSNEGLPIGVQIVARPWEEELVLAVAAEMEAQRGKWQARIFNFGWLFLLRVLSATFPAPLRSKILVVIMDLYYFSTLKKR
jgi:Asp-tRNA(Asn)/Glu-tRNA(Gln) amidotransferase A subunit family amidase